MDRLKLIDSMELALLQDGFCDNAAVQNCVLLHDVHVVNVIIKQTAFAPCHFIRYGNLGFSNVGLPFCKQLADFLCPACVSHLQDKGFSLSRNLSFSFFA